MLGCMFSSDVNKCIEDGCSLLLGEELCRSHVKERCISTERGCRTITSCGDYTQSHMDICENAEGCSILNGMD
jgi:hypothetical protein